jgi:hypothetical protein
MGVLTPTLVDTSAPAPAAAQGVEQTAQPLTPAVQSSASSARASQTAPEAGYAYFNDFADPADVHRVDHFVQYRDPFVVNHTTGVSDHDAADGVNCTAPEQTRTQSRERPEDHVYLCHPGGDPAAGHIMSYSMDTAGYGWVGGLPDQVFEGASEVSVDINTTSAGSRNFVEIKVMPAASVFANAMPCAPDLPCSDGWDYDANGGVAGFTASQEGTGLGIATPDEPDGYRFDEFNTFVDANGDLHHRSCDHNTSGYCFDAATHTSNTDIRDRYRHVLRDNGDGTLSFGVDEGDRMRWVTAPGAFPAGEVRMVVAFHNYTGTKDGNGPGFDNNTSPSAGGFTWHWDNLAVTADVATPSEQFYGGHSAERVVTPDGCVAFAQGHRFAAHDSDVGPEFRCVDNVVTPSPDEPEPEPEPPAAEPNPDPIGAPHPGCLVVGLGRFVRG